MKNILSKSGRLEWRVNTAALLQESIENNPGMSIMKVPFNVLREILAEVGVRASELNDPVLNALMCRLSLYAESDPYDKEYNEEIVDACLTHHEYLKYKKRKS